MRFIKKMFNDIKSIATEAHSLSCGIERMATKDELEKIGTKQEKLEKIFAVFESAFNNNMQNLAKHLESHKIFEEHAAELEKRIEKYVAQQLHNSQILQAYIEKELLLSQLANETCFAQINALAKSHWWEKITSKNREKIMLKAKIQVYDSYKDKLNMLSERLSKLTKETL